MKTILFITCLSVIVFKPITIVKPRFGCPFKKGMYIKPEANTKMNKAYAIPRSSIEIEGVDNQVVAVSSGVVYKILKYDGKYIVSVESGKFTIYYENLDSVVVSEQQKISSSNIVGMARDKRVEISILKDKIRLLHPEVLLNCDCKK